MPYARLKPLDPNRGYRRRSLSTANGLKMELGPDPDRPLWYVVSDDQAKYLAAQRINADPASPCIADIFPTKEAAEDHERREMEARKQTQEGRSIDQAIPAKGVEKPAADPEKEAMRAELEKLRAQLGSKPEPAVEPAGEPASEETKPQAEEKPKSAANVLTSADVRRPTPRR